MSQIASGSATVIAPRTAAEDACRKAVSFSLGAISLYVSVW